ncbi:helix-turn-helix transcriptional regulator [Acidimangrovimonas sediminis]|uniref:helix-turn-helix transcriptional regulator n=1 Tax=Acidimangrovimonas sediminis TaxID=2056283 RepID=UPI000C7F9FA2|nr:YafY family protein [Acidimangrovimonas sediminis]
MARTSRLFEIIQILRGATAPVVAADLAGALEVSERTIYRDIAALQAMRTPIEGAPGVGYVMRRGYDLPPVNFDEDEAEAVLIGLSLIARTGDEGLWQAGLRAARKLSDATQTAEHLIASSWGTVPSRAVDPGSLRQAIRRERKVTLHYSDAEGRQTERKVWPLVLIYYADNTVLVAHCELRQDFRSFRLDRMLAARCEEEGFPGQGAPLRALWEEQYRAGAVDTR